MIKEWLVGLALCVGATTVIAEDAPVKDENLHPSLGNWYLVDPEWNYEARTLIDTDPGSRASVQRFMMDRANIPASAASRANRYHVEFSDGAATLKPEQKKLLYKFISLARTGDRVFVLGFTNTKGGAKSNRLIARQRSQNVATLIDNSDLLPGRVSIETLTGPGWISGDSGRRAEVWVLSADKR